jgi:hypothetical protein
MLVVNDADKPLKDDPSEQERSAELVHGFLDGALDVERIAELQDGLISDSKTVQALVQAAVNDELLARHFIRSDETTFQSAVLAALRPAELDQRSQTPAEPGSTASVRRIAPYAIAAAFLLATGVAYFAAPREVAMVTRLVDAEVADGSSSHVGARLKEGDWLRVQEGLIEVTFDRGAVVAIKGPADFQVVSDMRAASQSGKITVDVGERAVGFTVETPSASVVDWGTKFGVGVDGEETDVIVFDGAVDLHARPDRRGAAVLPTRLSQGEALRVSGSGELHRIVSIRDSEFPVPYGGNIDSSSAPIISSVTDSIRDGDTNKYYRIVHGGLADDAPAYVDRAHQWNGLTAEGLPGFLVGADYVMPFNDDKRARGLRVAVTFARDASVYLFYVEGNPTPEWLSSRFKDTGVVIGLDEGASALKADWTTDVGGGESIDTHFRVWRCVVSAGERLVLGPRGPNSQTQTVPVAMYAVAATPLEAAEN